MTDDLTWIAFQALWHDRGDGEVSPIDQLAGWHDRDATDAEIAADLQRIAHASTYQRHRREGEPVVWLRIDVLAGEVLIDILVPEPKRTLRQAEVIALIRAAMVADDPPSRLGGGGHWAALNAAPTPPKPAPDPVPAPAPAPPPVGAQFSLF